MTQFITKYSKFASSTGPLILALAALITSFSVFITKPTDNSTKINLLESQVSTLQISVSKLTAENADCVKRVNDLLESKIKEKTVLASRKVD